ncbi:hypothetical protein HMPREF0663_10319 [Hoylesella oralis ATCC 33269]|uniref:Uncharacterized protein n=1 Tax=Hoylesella oralis ATCC 33269 TaxID=873533 RepID=E7RMG9_9BACT|nr:hypothetical protein HMPREF0663_10319 [Hoylesella oralis ATCC 33269]
MGNNAQKQKTNGPHKQFKAYIQRQQTDHLSQIHLQSIRVIYAPYRCHTR